MCTRINNLEALIRVLPQLEVKLEKASGVIQSEQKLVSAHAYVSSDATNDVTNIVTNEDAVTNSSSSGSIFREINRAKKNRPEEGFHSDTSHQLCKYLKHLRKAQLLLVCHRVIHHNDVIINDVILTVV